MQRKSLFIAASLLLGVGLSCKQSSPAATPVVVHVLRAPYFAADFTQADMQFAQTRPSVHSGRTVALQAKDDVPYWDVLKRLKVFTPDVLILYSQDFVPNDPAIKNQLGTSELVCGVHAAFIPTSVSGEEREAAQAYLNFLVSHCASRILVQPATAIATPTDGRAEEPENDPHRPACTSARCRRIKQFLKGHYCGESPFGNGPDDGCEIRAPHTPSTGVRVAADFECKWVEGVRECQQHRQPSPELRNILVGELRRLGLPSTVTKQVYFTVWESSSAGGSLAEAYYDNIEHDNLALCQVIAIIDQSSSVHVLRKVRFQKTDADKPTVTTWSPIDLADVDGEGHLDVILEGDAYEDHWFEVDTVQDGSSKTIFSGLGYYL